MSAPETAPPPAAPDLKPITCADCGRLGLEHWTDPLPGVCPPCMDERLLAVAAGLTHDALTDSSGARMMRNHHRRLLEAGVTPPAASRDVRRLAEAFDYPVPKEALAGADAAWERAVDAYLAEQDAAAPASRPYTAWARRVRRREGRR
jgi:hypothetical protein